MKTRRDLVPGDAVVIVSNGLRRRAAVAHVTTARVRLDDGTWWTKSTGARVGAPKWETARLHAWHAWTEVEAELERERNALPAHLASRLRVLTREQIERIKTILDEGAK